jgi:hypothetical protein
MWLMAWRVKMAAYENNGIWRNHGEMAAGEIVWRMA